MQAPRSQAPKIDSYSFGRITVDGRAYSADLILLPDGVAPDWWREEGHSLSVADLHEVFQAKPEVLVVGTGASGVMDVPQATRDAIASAGIQLIAERSGDAVETYNRLRGENRTAAALHLTC